MAPPNGLGSLKGLHFSSGESAGKETTAMHIECLMVVVGRTLGIPNTVPSNIYLSLTTRQDPIKHPAGIISFNPLTICSHFTDEET